MTFQLVELKNGETFNGHLINCDNFMNITLREVYQTNSDGDKFWKLKECYIRGSTVCHFFCESTIKDFPETLDDVYFSYHSVPLSRTEIKIHGLSVFPNTDDLTQTDKISPSS